MNGRVFPLWLIHTVLALVSFGVWGIFSMAASRKLPAWDVQVFSTFGMIPVVAAVSCTKDFLVFTNLRRGGAWALFSGAGTAAGNIALFAALSKGADASVVFPLTGMYPLITILLAWAILHERIDGLRKAGIAMALAAILIFSFVDTAASPAGAGRGPGVWVWMGLSLVCLLTWGATGVSLKLAARDISSGLSLAGYLVAYLIAALPIAAIEPLDWKAGWFTWMLCLGSGATFALGTWFLVVAYSTGGKVSVVSTVCALYPSLTVLASVAFWGERLTLVKIAAIILALSAGAVLGRETSDSSLAQPAELRLE
jgi:drug/metabolite transporter (DMT)-like permease